MKDFKDFEKQFYSNIFQELNKKTTDSIKEARANLPADASTDQYYGAILTNVILSSSSNTLEAIRSYHEWLHQPEE